MARSAKEEIPWKPRRQRRLEVQARVAHLQNNLPSIVREVFAGGESRGEAIAATEPIKPPKKSKFAVLPWEPRGDSRSD